ncbi:hypothetical protein DUI87_34003 [Hirundo rustica rustica]|uniref:B-box C-terminal domain-containing protein n=1 Tax=Hirundo rustica rustica TaxID=333673 RepID=A0A3M0IN92_HIRRU|nr:hypothetical protein DUI87_34003 [Hirundo rustica rustica]
MRDVLGAAQGSPAAPARRCARQLAAAVGLVAEISRQLGQRRAEARQRSGAASRSWRRRLRQRREVLLRDLEATCAAKQQALHHGSATEVLLVQTEADGRAAAAGAGGGGAFPEHPHENAAARVPRRARGAAPLHPEPGRSADHQRHGTHTVATGEGARQAVVGQPCSLSVTTKDKDGALVRSGGARLRFAVTGPDGAAAEAEVQDNRNGTYELAYTPRTEGDFVLSILLYGQPVRGSPSGSSAPHGVSVDTNGDIIVADYDNRWVSVFSPEGKFKTKLGAGRLMGPKGVAVDRNGHIIVVDNKACCVFIFQPNGKLVARFGSRGTAERQFAGPHFVAVNNKNEIVVTDFHNHSVKVYNAEGEFLFKFGSHGEGNGQFNAPTGVAVDSNGNIIVADWGATAASSAGSFLSYINTAADPLYGPQGLALTSDGHVVVADSGNHCFKAYRYLQ